jgi:hypothetical protein
LHLRAAILRLSAVMTARHLRPFRTNLTADERAFFREADPAGYILFGRNMRKPRPAARADR